ncbi:hypothetical protein SDC9_186048 [bioreactor metagenome]|uniref:Uncharacterized protein n=1 Tax=bioreactor metagenome TaxID=1076179 RepID=A0A645HQW3_9ZZZZ
MGSIWFGKRVAAIVAVRPGSVAEFLPRKAAADHFPCDVTVIGYKKRPRYLIDIEGDSCQDG